MANPLKSPGSSSLGLLFARLPLGVLFVIKGYEKLAGVGLAKFVAEKIKYVPKYMPPWFGNVYLSALPFAEMALGAFIVAGFLTRISGFFTSCLLISFLMITGVRDTSNANWPFHPNFFFLGLALLLFFAGGGGLGADGYLFDKKSGGSPKHG